ncbi:hypothetical protein F5Y19DRAFT_77450 [Xylariaceae sp. FL1651]|nr:hypothetical protein F5Y19DRAFT_77450 [Xylariaceae sp. FL1651]
MVAVRYIQQFLFRFLNLPWLSLPWKVVSFYEELPLPGRDFRAIEYDQTDLWTFPQIALQSHHHDMCRFTSPNDPSYIKVIQSLRDITQGSSVTNQVTVSLTPSPAEKGRLPDSRRPSCYGAETFSEVLKSLACEDRFTNIQIGSPGTGDWIFDHDRFKSWQKEPSTILWISGKAGSGKTTLMKHLVDHHLRKNASSTHVAYFFFSHHCKVESVTDLLGSLMYQTLKSAPSWLTLDTYTQLIERREILGSDRPWDEDVLTENFLQLVDKTTAPGCSVLFVIDALDECHDADKVVGLFQSLATTLNPVRNIRVCFSSRLSPSLDSTWEICMESNNFSDIKKATSEKLATRRFLFSSALDIQEIAQSIAEKAQGVFLWASLVIANLLRESHLKPFKLVHDLTWKLPMDFDAAYETVLGRLLHSRDAKTRRFTLDALVLVLCAKRPLSILELQNALIVTGGDEYSRNKKDPTQGRQGKLEVINQRHEVTSPNTASWLLILCGGLLEASPRSFKSSSGIMTASGPKVHFVHQTVSDFLRENCGSALETDIGEGYEANLDFRVARLCFNYISRTLSASPLFNAHSAASESPFLEYSVSYGMQHLSLACRMVTTSMKEAKWQFSPFQDVSLNQWVSLHNNCLGDQDLFKPHTTKAAHVMSYFGLPWFDTGLWGVSIADINHQDHRGQTPLSFAAAMGHLDLCRLLLDLGAHVGHRDHIYGQSPLSLAAAHGHRDIVRLLLRMGSDPNNDTSGASPLWMATCGGHLPVSQLLLEAGADARSIDIHTGETVLSRAAALGHIPIINSLLKSGAKVESWDKRGWTPVHHAISRSRKKTIEILLRGLRKDQLHSLRIGLVKAQHSWVNTVLRAVVLGLAFQQYGQTETPPSGSSQESKAPSPSNHNRATATPSRKRERHNLDPDSDEDDCEEENQGASEKRPRHSKSAGRRFACPYHRRNATKYSRGACNGAGFADIHRLKQHLKFHSRVEDRQRCHICQARFPHDKIAGHGPCVKQDKPTDYEDGFDAVQLNKLKSKDMFPGRSSEENCWYAIFKVLFPDWPETEDIPSPYQDHQIQAAMPHFRLFINELQQTLMSSETISKIRDSSLHDQGDQRLRETMGRLVEDMESKLGLPPMTKNNQPNRRSTADLITASSLSSAAHSRPIVTSNITTSEAFLQPLCTPQNFAEPPVETVGRSMGHYQGSNSFLPFPERSPFQMHLPHSPNAAFNRHGSVVSSSGPESSFYSVPYDGSETHTDNTAFSDYDPNGSERWGPMCWTGAILQNSQQMDRPILQLPVDARRSSNMGYILEMPYPTDYQNTVLSSARPNVPSDPQQPQQGYVELGQTETTQRCTCQCVGGNTQNDSATVPSRIRGHNHGPMSQA